MGSLAKCFFMTIAIAYLVASVPAAIAYCHWFVSPVMFLSMLGISYFMWELGKTFDGG